MKMSATDLLSLATVTVSKWHFKQPATEANAGDKRRRVGGASAAEQLSAGQHEPSDHVTRVDRDSSSAQNDMLSDDTILAVITTTPPW